MVDSVTILGSTGSIGRQALDVCRMHGIRVDAISAGRNIDVLEKQIAEFRPKICGVADEKSADELKKRISGFDTKIITGNDSAAQTAAECGSECILNSVSGVAGLAPTLAAIKTGARLALANKESLVTAGRLVLSEAKKNNVEIIPVDSEHSAIFQSLSGQKIKNIILTASGGPFYGKKRDVLETITPEQALAHPTWNMGSRITIDSATLMNKGFEVIEAIYLFGVRPEQVKVCVHRESIIHSMVEYEDSAIIGEMGKPDMRLCIQYAFTYPERIPSPVPHLDFTSLGSLSFLPPDYDTFRLLPLAFEAYNRSESSTAALNGADEEAVEMFLKKEIGFTDIFDFVAEAVEKTDKYDINSAEDAYYADMNARKTVRELAEKYRRI